MKTWMISSDKQAIDETIHEALQDFISRKRSGYAIKVSDFLLRLALDEALTNAWRHGNRCDRSKSIILTLRFHPERVDIVVRDEGAGFTPCRIPPPYNLENIFKRSGRGIYLLRILAAARWNSRGNVVHMTLD